MIQTYYNPNLFKTNAPADIIYDIFKKYKKDNYGQDYLKNVKEETYKYKILNKEIKVDPIFTESFTNHHPEHGDNIPKYLPNPTKNWGPKGRAKLIKYFTTFIKHKFH
jgi:hypothetical protein